MPQVQVIEIEPEMLSKHCILFCLHCGTWTQHILSKSGEYYACSCGTIIDVELKENEND